MSIRTTKYEELKALCARMALSVVSMRDAIRTGNIDSPEIGNASTGNHKWHEEWESYADKTLTEYTNFMKGERK